MMTSGDGIAQPQKVLFPAERLSLRWSQAQRVGAGLQNMGNTCFLNAALQCLSYTPPLANYMLTREHSKTCTPWAQPQSRDMVIPPLRPHTHGALMVTLCSCAGHEPGFCMMCTMQNHVIQVFANAGNVIKPLGVLNELKSMQPPVVLRAFINNSHSKDCCKIRTSFIALVSANKLCAFVKLVQNINQKVII